MNININMAANLIIAVDALRQIAASKNGDARSYHIATAALAEIEINDAEPICTCGASKDPGACGHHPDCPLKATEG